MKKVLVINPFGIGDVLFSMVLVQALKNAYAGAEIGFLCNERTERLVRLNPAIHEVFVFDRDFFRRLWPAKPFLLLKKFAELLGAIRKQRYEAVFDLSLGREYSFFMRWIGIRRRIGFNYKSRGLFLNHKKKISGYSDKPVADIQLGLLDDLNIAYDRKALQPLFHIPDEAKERLNVFLKERNCREHDKILAVAPGGGRSWGKDAVYKQWDAKYFAGAIDHLSREHHLKVVLLGDESERELLLTVASLASTPLMVMAGEAVESVCACLLRAEILLGNDGGLLHLANFLGVKTVGIFGPVDEKVYGPYWKNVFHETLTEPVPCRPCYKHFHFPPCPHERRCLTELSVERVVRASEKLIQVSQ